MITINEDDISKVEKYFLPSGERFTDEKKQILKCMDSRDIVACPGSGKTTTLLAKLSIIEKHLPFSNNKGICVLTHTNVAIDEIKERLGEKSKKLFEYPNFFGTIQSFVNQFLTTPFYRNIFGKNIVSINDEIYNREIVRDFFLINNNIKIGLRKKYKDDLEMLNESLMNMRFNFNDDSLCDRTGKPLYKTKNPTSLALTKLKKGIMKKGILCYEDAYWLAYKYLNKCGNQLTELFSERFSFLFIDEMQDTSQFQCELLNKLFDKERVIIQRFGDPNQSIYENGEVIAWDLWTEPLRITDSKRNSEIVSKIIAPFEIGASGMRGNLQTPEIAPKIIVYEEKEIEKVLPQFAKIIIDSGLNGDSNNVFKAVGRIAKINKNGKISISSYFPNYNQKTSGNNSKKIKYLNDYLSMENIDPLAVNEVKLYKDSILSALLRILWLLGIKKDQNNYFTNKTLLKKLHSEDDSLFLKFEENLYNWCLKMKRRENVKSEFIDFSNELLYRLFNIQDVSKLKVFYEETSAEEEAEIGSSNIYTHYIEEDSPLEIHINTVAGVKGETHTGTLFFETFHYTYDVGNLIDFYKGKIKEKKGVRQKAAAKNAYVAMSRPSHLLCVAAQKSSIDGHEEALLSVGWEIIQIS
ncbi:UvrD-helicase domain-containing protein [Peribacillus butanolivorans]|uniref:UvrD-helicase domain-containing protein n=1 Tax=Peribacillus butanolivorans TaxID=421767 RepID=UPI00369AFD8B